MPDPWITALGIIVVAVVSGGVSVLVARINTRSSQKTATTTATTPPYDSMVTRLERVEKKCDEQDTTIDSLRGKLIATNDRLQVVIHDRDALVSYVRQWHTWFSDGAKPPPPPIPRHLRDLLDPDQWDVAHITERTTTTTFVTPPHHGADPPESD